MLAAEGERRADLQHVAVRALAPHQDEVVPHVVEDPFGLRPRRLQGPAVADQFDADLERIVRTFQRDHRLDVDGLAGQQTQIIINSLLAIDGTPRLTTPRLAQD